MSLEEQIWALELFLVSTVVPPLQARDSVQANVTQGDISLACDFTFVYKLGKTRLDLRRSTADCRSQDVIRKNLWLHDQVGDGG